MKDFAPHAVKVMEAVLDRSKAALNHLGAGEIDRALAFLKKRTAAFHNFRAVDALAKSAGQDLAENPSLVRLTSELEALDQVLAKALAEARSDTEKLKQKLSEARGKISRYRSGARVTPYFTRTV